MRLGIDSMKLRWHIKRNKVTAQTIKDYQEIHGGGIIQAKNKLMKQTHDLEYYNEDTGNWEVIPTVLTEIEPDLSKE